VSSPPMTRPSRCPTRRTTRQGRHSCPLSQEVAGGASSAEPEDDYADGTPLLPQTASGSKRNPSSHAALLLFPVECTELVAWLLGVFQADRGLGHYDETSRRPGTLAHPSRFQTLGPVEFIRLRCKRFVGSEDQFPSSEDLC
jgi:hypothetical protein